MDAETEGNALVEGSHWLARPVDVNVLFRLHVACLMVNCCLYHSISDGLQCGL